MSARRVARHDSSRYGPLFWVSLAPGWLAIAFGAVSLWNHSGSAARTSFLVWFVGAALVHDAVVAPLALAAGTLVARRAPAAARATIGCALFVSAVVALAAWPVARRLGAIDNASFLPRPAGVALLVLLALVWAVAGLVLIRRRQAGS